MPANHPLADTERIGLEDILKYPFVLREKGSGTRRVMEDELARKGIDPDSLQIKMELGSTGAIKSAVEVGLGLSIVSQSAVKHEVSLGLLKEKELVDAAFKRDFYAIYLDTTLLPLSALSFLTFLRTENLQKWL